MAEEPPILDLHFDELPQLGEPWVKTFELANNFSGLSSTYRLPFDPATTERALNNLEFPERGMRRRSPAEVLSTTNDLVKYLLQINRELRITGWDMGNVDAGRTFVQHVIGECNPTGIDYAVQRVQNLADPEREPVQKEADTRQTIKLVQLANRFGAAGRQFSPPGPLWIISPADMTSMEQQAAAMFPSGRPARRPPQPGH